jgi:hypothetical protein
MRDDVDAVKLFADRVGDASATVRCGNVRRNERFRFGMTDPITRRGQYRSSLFAQPGHNRSANASRGAGHESASALQFSWH